MEIKKAGQDSVVLAIEGVDSDGGVLNKVGSNKI